MAAQSLDDLGVAVEDFAQLGRRLHAMLLHRLEQAEDVADAGEGDAFFPRQVLDDLDLCDVPLGVAAAVGRRAMRLDEARVLVEHEGSGMGLQDLRRDADRVERLVEVAERSMGAARAASTTYRVRHGPPILCR